MATPPINPKKRTVIRQLATSLGGWEDLRSLPPKRDRTPKTRPPLPPPTRALENKRKREQALLDRQAMPKDLCDAAHASRLHAHGMSKDEFKLFRHHLGPPKLQPYLMTRNTMLKLWRDRPKTRLLLTEAIEATTLFGLHSHLIEALYEFLIRHGYINFGVFETPGGRSASDTNGTGSLSLSPNNHKGRPGSRSSTTTSSSGSRTAGVTTQRLSTTLPKSSNRSAKHETLEQDSDVAHADLGYPTSEETIVVVGAGMAGIGCAGQLQNLFRQFAHRFAHGAPRVVVLEGRSRIGGRIHTTSLDTKAIVNKKSSLAVAPGTRQHRVDLGAQIITGFENGNPMEIIVRRQLTDLQLYYLLNDTCDLFDSTGASVPKDVDVKCEAVFNQILDQACSLRKQERTPKALKEYLIMDKAPEAPKARPGPHTNRPPRKHLTRAASVQDSNTNTHSAQQGDIIPTLGNSMDYFLESHPDFATWTEQELALIHWHYANLEFANATPLDQLSLRHWDQDDDYEFGGKHAMVVGGYGQIPQALSWDLDIRLEQPVQKVSYRHTVDGKESAVVECADKSVHAAHSVVITVPLGVLKSNMIQFSPPLPDWKQNAISHLGFGLLNKLVLVFEKPFWNLEAELFGFVGGPHGTRGKKHVYDRKVYQSCRGKFYMFWNCVVVSGLPVLVTLMAGQSAYDCENYTEDELVDEALDTLALIYPNIPVIPKPVETVVTRWSRDEFAGGSYSFVGPEGDGTDYDALARPINKQVYFAGEATSRHYPATAHGAYLTGVKVAKEILDSLIGEQIISDEHEVDDDDEDDEDDDEDDDDDDDDDDDGDYHGKNSSSDSGSDRSMTSASASVERSGKSVKNHLESLRDAQTTDSPPRTTLTRNSKSHLHGRRRVLGTAKMVMPFVAHRDEDSD